MTTPALAVVPPQVVRTLGPALIGVVGLPGSGKSHFARSARELGKTAVALTDPKEETTYGTEGVTTFYDLDWRPHVNSYNATGFNRLLAWCDAQCGSDAKYIVIDTGSEASDLAMHEVLKIHATGDPSDVPHGKGWTGHDQKIKELVIELRRLQARGKTVIVTFHGQMKELEGAGTAQKRVSFGDKNVQEFKFDEQLLPAVYGSIRQRIHSVFALWLYTNPIGFGAARKYYLTAVADNVRPAKVAAGITFKAGVQASMIPNTLKALLESVEVGK